MWAGIVAALIFRPTRIQFIEEIKLIIRKRIALLLFLINLNIVMILSFSLIIFPIHIQISKII